MYEFFFINPFLSGIIIQFIISLLMFLRYKNTRLVLLEIIAKRYNIRGLHQDSCFFFFLLFNPFMDFLLNLITYGSSMNNLQTLIWEHEHRGNFLFFFYFVYIEPTYIFYLKLVDYPPRYHQNIHLLISDGKAAQE